MAKSLKVAVLGATGLVGREILHVLEERCFPVGELVPLLPPERSHECIEFAGKQVRARRIDENVFTGIDLVLMAAGSTLARELAPLAVKAGAVVVDGSSAWRAHADVPLVVPEVNAADIESVPAGRIVSSPSGSTIPLAVAIAPLHRHAGIKRLTVASYQAVSGKGQPGMSELGEQVQALFRQNKFAPKVFPKRIAFNCIPQIGPFADDGFAQEEQRLSDETRKVLHLPHLGVCATCVRVPVFNGHCETVVAEFEQPMDARQAREILKSAPGVMLMDDTATGVYPTPADVEGTDATCVGRVRTDPAAPHSVVFWCVVDSLRKGSATNVVQIAETLARHGL